MTIAFSDLFTRIGKLCHIADLIATSAGTTVPADVEAFLTLMQSESDPVLAQAVVAGIDTALTQSKTYASNSLSSLVAAPMTNLIVQMVTDDQPLLSPSLANCLAELIGQMEDAAETVDKSTVTITTIYGEGGSSSGVTGDNVGNGVLVWSTKRGDGRVNEFIVSETVTAVITSSATSGSAVWKLAGEPVKSLLAPDWPGGSGMSRNITSHTAASGSNLVPSGTFETADTADDDLPDGWIASVATLGTTLKITPVAQHTVTINGGPTGGYYTLSYTTWDGTTYTTTALAFDASASDIQAALNELPDLSEVEVTSTGTSPDITATVVFYGVRRPLPLTYASYLTGGTPTITITELVAASTYTARAARCLQIIGNGSQLTTLQVPISTAAKSQYAVNLLAVTDDAPATGVLVVDLCDGIGGSTIADDQGVANTFTIDCTALLTGHRAFNGCFRLPSTLPAEVYLRIRLTTAVENGKNVFIDELCMVPMTEMTAGGASVAAFSGEINFVVADEATTTIVNDRGGSLHEWINRCLSLASQRLLLPTDTAPATNPDSLIA